MRITAILILGNTIVIVYHGITYMLIIQVNDGKDEKMLDFKYYAPTKVYFGRDSDNMIGRAVKITAIQKY